MYVTQFYPNRIVTTWKKPKDGKQLDFKHFRFFKRCISTSNLKTKKTSVSLSKSSKRAIRDSINGMYILSTPRTIKLPSNKIIYNYRQSFITMTLPSGQIHSDVEIKKCLNNFLTSLRTSIGVSNYVWKAELQKNENIHFHLVIDKYCSYQAIRHYWNKAINTLGYVDRYAEKMRSLTLTQYAELRQKQAFEVAPAYADGCRSNWSSPNSVDVVSVRRKRTLVTIYQNTLLKMKIPLLILSVLRLLVVFGQDLHH